MKKGKKSLAEKIFYKSIDKIKSQVKVDDGLINSGKIGKLTSTLFQLYKQKIEDKYSNE